MKIKVVSVLQLENLVDKGAFPQVRFGYSTKGKKYPYEGVIIAANDCAGEFKIKRRSSTTGEIQFRGPLKTENLTTDIYLVGFGTSADDVDFVE
jgi:hypothetical protein